MADLTFWASAPMWHEPVLPRHDQDALGGEAKFSGWAANANESSGQLLEVGSLA